MNAVTISSFRMLDLELVSILKTDMEQPQIWAGLIGKNLNKKKELDLNWV